MNILDIAIAKKLAGGGGGSGTDNYNDLSNLPKINDTTLSGNKSSSALGLQSEINSDSKLASDLVDDTNQDNKFVTSTEKSTWNAKQNAIDADHKINADYVDDSTSTDKFVTASDKETWNAKQNAIDNSHKLSSDLVDDANHTNKFVTSTEKQTWNAKQNAIDADHKLSSSLVSFTTAEAAALASGIDSSKVGQISTNQTNILYALQTGVKNLCPLDTLTTSGGETNHADVDLPAGTYHIYCTTTASTYSVVLKDANNQNLYYHDHSGSPLSIDVTITGTAKTFYIWNSSAATFSDVMICPKVAWDAEPNVFRPYALPNYDLTYLQAEDRASLAEVVDSGAKNKLQYDLTSLKAKNTSGTWNNNAYTIGGITYTLNSDMSISISGTRSGTDAAIFNLADYTAVSGDLMSQGTVGVQGVFFYARGGSSSCNSIGTTLIESTDIGVNRIYALAVTAAGLTVNQRYYPMICTKAAFCLSSAFVPYRYDPYTTAWQNISNSTTLYARRCGRVVTVNGYMDNISFTANTAVTIGTIDSSIGIPPNQVRAVCNVGSNAYSVGKQGYVTISSTDGQIKVTSEYSGTGAVYFSLSYII